MEAAIGQKQMMMRVEVIMQEILDHHTTFMQRGDHLNEMDLVQMPGVSVQGCGDTIHCFTLG